MPASTHSGVAAVRGTQRAVGVLNYLEVSSAGLSPGMEGGDPGEGQMRAPRLELGGGPSRLWSSTALPAPLSAALSPQEAAERLNSVLPVKFIISSRTDAGVHALCNAAHLDVQRRSGQPPFSPEILTHALNSHLKHPAIRCAAALLSPTPPLH